MEITGVLKAMILCAEDANSRSRKQGQIGYPALRSWFLVVFEFVDLDIPLYPGCPKKKV